MANDIVFNPNPVQKAFIESRAKADLYSSRMGEGKSTALAWSAFYHTRHNPGAHHALIRDTWENMQRTTHKTFMEWFREMGTYHETKRTFTWAEGAAKGDVLFLGMDEPKDAAKLMSLELAGIGIDEPAPAVGSVGIDEMIFDLGISRLRQKDMKWYTMKLAENNPDEGHWTFKKFVAPGMDGFVLHQPSKPENIQNLPSGYYAELRKVWAHRPDLIRRFVEGEFGFQSEGRSVTPQWSDRLHLALGLSPIPRHEIILLWDWGHNPTCIITQRTPMGHWMILDSVVGNGIGAAELVEDFVKPLLVERYRRSPLRHIGDPAGMTPEQTSIHRTPVKLIKKVLGGSWRPGPVKTMQRVEPLRAVLSRTVVDSDGHPRGIVQVDRDRAKEVWYALRGGWHFPVARTGVISADPKKNEHSHPGDAMGYGAAILYPLGSLQGNKPQVSTNTPEASYFGSGKHLTFGPQPSTIPNHGEKMFPSQTR